MLQQPERNLNPEGETRIGDELDRLDRDLGKLGTDSMDTALDILRRVDSIHARIREAQKKGNGLKAESAQMDSLLATIRREAGLFVHVLGKNTLAQERARVQPGEERWWWYLDRVMAERQRRAIFSVLRTAMIVVGVLAVVALVYNRFFQPDPLVLAQIDAVQTGQTFAQQGDLTSALAAVEGGLQKVPGDAELLTLKGVILTLNNDLQEADAAFSAAQRNLGNDESFYLIRCQINLSLGRPDASVQDAQSAIQLNPKSATAYLLLGTGLELKQDYENALRAYENSADFGLQTGNDQIVAQAKIKMGMLIQMMGQLSGPPPTTTPAP